MDAHLSETVHAKVCLQCIAGAMDYQHIGLTPYNLQGAEVKTY